MAGSAVRPKSRSSASIPGLKGRARAARPAPTPTVLGRVFARPGVIVAGATFAAVMTGIVANALLFQKGHHPSPLFSPAPAEASAAAPSAAPAPPAVAPMPVRREIIEAPAPAPTEEAPAPTPKAPEPSAPSSKTASRSAHATGAPVPKPAHKKAAAPHHDLIGELLGKQGH